MAGIYWSTSTPTNGGATWVTNTAIKTIKQISAPTNQRVKVLEWDISFNGTSNTAAPIDVDVVVQTSAGTGLGAATIQKLNRSDQETIQSTGLDGIAATLNSAEPTDAGVGAQQMSEYVHPQQGYPWRTRFGAEIHVQGGTRLGIRTTAGASVNVIARITAEE